MFRLLNVHVNVYVTIINVMSFYFFCLCHYHVSLINVCVIFLIYVSIILMFVLWSFIYILLFANVFYLVNLQKIAKKRGPLRDRLVVSFRILVWVGLCLCLCFLHSCLDKNHLFLFKWICKYWLAWYECSGFINTSSLKKEFRGNWGAILDFPGVPNENKS